MTIDEFYAHVRECGPWELTPDGIRQCDTSDCPVLAVSRKLGVFSFWDNELWDRAATAIDLDRDEAHEVVCAADSAQKRGNEFYCPDPALAAACGFTEEGRQ